MAIGSPCETETEYHCAVVASDVTREPPRAWRRRKTDRTSAGAAMNSTITASITLTTSDGVVVLGPPFVFNAGNIDQFDF